MTLNQIKIIAIVFCLIIFTNCNPALDFNYGTQVSSSINESKNAGVFISQYKIENILMNNKAFIFPIKEVWAEKSWSMNLDSAGKEFREIHDSSNPNLVFLLNKNDSLREDNYMEKWILSDTDSSSNGVTNHIIFMPLKSDISDTLQLYIYKLSVPYNYKENLERIASFSLKRQ